MKGKRYVVTGHLIPFKTYYEQKCVCFIYQVNTPNDAFNRYAFS